MIEIFCILLPAAVCLIALPTIALKLHKQCTDSLLIALCVTMLGYLFVYGYPQFPNLFLWTRPLLLVILVLGVLWAHRASSEQWFRWEIVLYQHYRDREWSARDHYLIRSDISFLSFIVIDVLRQVAFFYLRDVEWVTCLIAVLQATAVYLFFSSTIYAYVIESPAVNRDTLRAVQQARQSRLRDSFEQLMQEQKPFLKQGITIEDVALMLATNRTYISRMLHDDYSCTFPEYMTEKRLEYSKQFLSEHPHEVQEEVAFQCGFSSASAFNKRFRDAYGVTPREWQIANKHREGL